MYKILIVDDEQDIADGLYIYLKSISEFEIEAHRVYSSSEALDWMNRAKADIVISDICMPKMNGLELMGEIKRAWPECRVLFLTGFDEFDYIYEAHKYEGVYYLLKTEGFDEVYKYIIKLIEEIEESLRINDVLSFAKNQIDKALPLLQKEYFDYLLQEDNISIRDISKQFCELGISINTEYPIFLVMGKIPPFPSNISFMEAQKLIYSVKLILEQYLSSVMNVVTVIPEKNFFIWLLQPANINCNDGNTNIWHKGRIYINETLSSIQASCKLSLNINISLLLNKEPVNLQDLYLKIGPLKEIFIYGAGVGTDIMIVDEKNEENLHCLQKANIQTLQNQQKNLRKLSGLLESNQKDEFLKVLTVLTKDLTKVESMHNGFSIELYHSIAIIFLSYINLWGMGEKIAFSVGLYKLTRIDDYASWHDAKEYLFKIAETIFSLKETETKNTTISSIDFIKRYINEHIHEDVTLTTIAEVVHFNPSYLSRLFKKVTGINLLTYINDTRVSKAKELLENSNMKISDIAEAVGLISAPYFTQLYKKEFNISPNEYRAKFQKGKETVSM